MWVKRWKIFSVLVKYLNKTTNTSLLGSRCYDTSWNKHLHICMLFHTKILFSIYILIQIIRLKIMSIKTSKCTLNSAIISGTCHMASFFSSLPGTTTAAICSSSNLLVATFTQHLASHPTSGSLLTTSSALRSPLTVTSLLDQKELTSLLALLLISNWLIDWLINLWPRASQWRIYYHRMWVQLSTTCSNYRSSPMGSS